MLYSGHSHRHEFMMREAHHVNKNGRILYKTNLIIFGIFPEKKNNQKPTNIANPNHPHKIKSTG